MASIDLGTLPFLLSMFLKFHKQIVLSKRASCCCVPSWSASYHNIYLKSKILQEMQIAFSFLYKCQQCNCLLLIFLLWSDSQPESVRLSLNIWVCWTMTPANLIQLSDFSCVATANSRYGAEFLRQRTLLRVPYQVVRNFATKIPVAKIRTRVRQRPCSSILLQCSGIFLVEISIKIVIIYLSISA